MAFDPVREGYETWRQLPFVTEASFGDALADVVRELDVGGIFSPNIVVWEYLSQHLSKLAPGVALLNESPVDNALASYRSARARARMDIGRPLSLEAGGVLRAPLSEIRRAALYRYVDTVPGMCDHEKTAALCEIAMRAPSGDVVEIGSWWGKSAAVLANLIESHDIGNLLCVDPWSPSHLIQNDDSGLVDGMADRVDTDEALAIFQLSLLPCAAGRVNYLRLPSESAAKHFRHDREVVSDTFGRTTYQGRIAILHIDGNHAYDAVCGDINAWCDRVVPGGWIILDDYVWPFGDGPKQAGDEFLASRLGSLNQAFVMGSALFIQLR
ncbi:MAG: class I SAM-dependent methyltransferase [Burkholderiales bacterium]|nr:class I SAM-dependent methyltransferase [Burkholderiales bacterium]